MRRKIVQGWITLEQILSVRSNPRAPRYRFPITRTNGGFSLEACFFVGAALSGDLYAQR